jgi:hypothetical protein
VVLLGGHRASCKPGPGRIVAGRQDLHHRLGELGAQDDAQARGAIGAHPGGMRVASGVEMDGARAVVPVRAGDPLADVPIRHVGKVGARVVVRGHVQRRHVAGLAKHESAGPARVDGEGLGGPG